MMVFSSLANSVQSTMDTLWVLVQYFRILIICTPLMVFNHLVLIEARGEKCWTQLIPIYGNYITFKAFWKRTPFFICLAIMIYYMTPIAQIQNKFIIIVNIILSIIFVVIIFFVLTVKMCESFNHGIIFGIGAILLYPAFQTILMIEQLGKGVLKNISPVRKIIIAIVVIISIILTIMLYKAIF